MKKLLLLSVFFCLSPLLFAQITWPTYYVIAPTSGCDGVWAINTSQTGGSCGTIPYTYNFNPFGCGDQGNMTWATDTLFIPLCNLPCDLTILNSSGQTCICSTNGAPNEIEDLSNSQLKVFPNHVTAGGFIQMHFEEIGSEKTIQLFDISGKLIDLILTSNSKIHYQIPTHVKGFCFVVVSSNWGWTKLIKLIIE